MKQLFITCIVALSFFISCNQPDDILVENENMINAKSAQNNGWITLEQSKNAAIHHLNSFGFNGEGGIFQEDIEESLGIEDENQNTTIYIHNLSNGGFIMMSGSVYEVPVLAYSSEGTIDIEDMPDELSQWLFLGSKKIAYLQEKQSSYKESSWSNELGLIDQWGNWHPAPEFEITILDEYEENIYGSLLNVLWGQGIGFNTFAPNLGCSGFRTGVNAWAGCVPTAMGQIMHYHQWPTTYNWNIMPQRMFRSPNPLDNIGTAGQIATAQLLRNLGHQLGATYQCDGTGASNNNVRGVFITNNYQASNLMDYQYDVVAGQMEINRPVYISGMNEKITNYAIRWKIFGTPIRLIKSYSYKGHAWVADGTKQYVVVSKVKNLDTGYESIHTNKSKYIHFNWGWTEADMPINNPRNSNGWYYYDLFDPGRDTNNDNLIDYDDDYQSSIAPYNMKRRMIINITPN